jgi:hypothetical protein
MAITTREGLLRIRGGMVQFRKVDGKFWRDLVQVDALLGLNESGPVDPGPTDPPPDTGPSDPNVFVQSMTPNGRDLEADGWLKYVNPGVIRDGALRFISPDPSQSAGLRRDVQSPDMTINTAMALTLGADLRFRLREAFPEWYVQVAFFNYSGTGPQVRLSVIIDAAYDDIRTVVLTPREDGLYELDMSFVGKVLTVNGQDFTITHQAGVRTSTLLDIMTTTTAEAALHELTVTTVERAPEPPPEPTPEPPIAGTYDQAMTPDGRDLGIDGWTYQGTARASILGGALVLPAEGLRMYQPTLSLDMGWRVTYELPAETANGAYLNTNLYLRSSDSRYGHQVTCYSFFPGEATIAFDNAAGEYVTIPVPVVDGLVSFTGRLVGNVLTINGVDYPVLEKPGGAPQFWLGNIQFTEAKIRELTVISY